MRSARALRQVERAADPRVRARERPGRPARARPHLQAHLDRLFHDVEPLGKRGERKAEARGFLGIVAGADGERGAPAGEHVEGGHDLRQQPGRPVGRRGRQAEQTRAPRVRRDVRQGRVRLELALVRATRHRVLPDVIGDADEVEYTGQGALHLP